MEHVFHLFGGGCGEHVVWPWLVSGGSGLLVVARAWLHNGDEQC